MRCSNEIVLCVLAALDFVRKQETHPKKVKTTGVYAFSLFVSKSFVIMMMTGDDYYYYYHYRAWWRKRNREGCKTRLGVFNWQALWNKLCEGGALSRRRKSSRPTAFVPFVRLGSMVFKPFFVTRVNYNFSPSQMCAAAVFNYQSDDRAPVSSSCQDSYNTIPSDDTKLGI